MRRFTLLILLAALCATARPGAAAPTTPASAAATTRPQVTQAATRPAASQDGEAEKEKVAARLLIEAAKKSFVVVNFWYKKDLSEPVASEDNWQISRLYGEFVDKKRPEEMPGIVLDDQGHIIISDSGLEDRFLDKIVIVGATGANLPAKRDKLLFYAPGVLLKVDPASAGSLKPVAFGALKDEGLNTDLQQVMLGKSSDNWLLRISQIQPAVRFAAFQAPAKGQTGAREPSPETDDVFYGAHYSAGFASDLGSGPSAPVLVGDANGIPVGIGLERFMDLRQSDGLWKGPDLMTAEGISWDKLGEAEKQCRTNLTSCAYEVVLTLRQGEGQPGRPGQAYADRPATGQEVSAYGVAISPAQVLVPLPLDRNSANLIDKIYLKLSPLDRRRVDFVGAFKDFSAFVVALPKGQLPNYVKPAKSDLPKMKPFWAARVRKRFGDMYVDLTTNRLYGKVRGYAGQYGWYAAREMKAGTLLIDLDGNLAGMYLAQRAEHEEEQRLEQAQGYHPPAPEMRIFEISEIRDKLASPQAFLDPKIKVKPRSEAKRRAWFGVEFVAINPDLAEQFKVQKATKDGQLGFVVDAVYDGSPAQKMGIKVGDILLKLSASGMPYPVELSSRLAAAAEYGGYRPSYGQEGEEEADGVEQSWKSRSNFLTRALDAIGVGNKVAITYCRPEEGGEGKVQSLEYVIEQAPPDWDSAAKWKNRKLGLTVKDVTYEIRYALNLKPADLGVIVAKVEEGSPTLVARIMPNEILVRLDDQPLTSARQMRDLIVKAHKEGKKSVRLTVLHLGKTRFADLSIAAYDPADDEGLDED